MSEGEKQPINAYDLLTHTIETFAEVAWVKLGLRPDFVTGTISTDLAQAKVCIDTVSELVRIMSDQLEEDDRRTLNNIVRDLRVNYLERSKA
jgi:tRNA U55 pseudouridine synthase TruB